MVSPDLDGNNLSYVFLLLKVELVFAVSNRSNVKREQPAWAHGPMGSVPCGGRSCGREKLTLRSEREREGMEDEKMPVFMDVSFSHPLLLYPEPGLSETSVPVPALYQSFGCSVFCQLDN